MVKRLLEGYQGYLQSDGWHAYESVCSENIKGVACWTHVRRKFKDAEKANKTGSTRIKHAVATIQRLYKIEKQSGEQSAEEHHYTRQAQALPAAKPGPTPVLIFTASLKPLKPTGSMNMII